MGASGRGSIDLGPLTHCALARAAPSCRKGEEALQAQREEEIQALQAKQRHARENEAQKLRQLRDADFEFKEIDKRLIKRKQRPPSKKKVALVEQIDKSAHDQHVANVEVARADMAVVADALFFPSLDREKFAMYF